MPRLRNELTGAVMTVPEATATRLGSEWVPADTPALEEKAAAKSPVRSRKPEVAE